MKLFSLPPKTPENFENGQVVSVKVVEKGKDMATLLVNGQKIRAHLDADVPDHFLAFALKQGESVQLRLLSSLQKSGEMNRLRLSQMSDQVRLFLNQNGLSPDEPTLSASFLLLSKGRALSAPMIRMVSSLIRTYGEDFTSAFLLFSEKGIELNHENANFFFGLRNLFRKALKGKAFESRDGSLTESGEFSSNEDFRAELLSLGGGLFGEGFSAAVFRFGEDEALMMSRKKADPKSYLFELSGEDFGAVYVIVTETSDHFDVILELNERLYLEIGEKALFMREGMEKKLSTLTTKNLNFGIRKMEDGAKFFRFRENQSGDFGAFHLNLFA